MQTFPKFIPMLTFPKYIQIANPRLNALYYLSMVVTIAFLVFKFIYMNEAKSMLSIDDNIRVALWVTGADDYDALTHAFSRTATLPLCTSPQQYDYWWDRGGIWKYENYSCLPLCDAGQAGKTCISTGDTYMIEGQDQVFIPTQVKETYFTLAGSNGSSQTEFYFVPSVEALGIGFSYGYDVPKPESLFIIDSAQSSASTRDILTVVLNSDGRTVNETLPPNGSVSLTVPKLLELAGKRDLLDAPQLDSYSWPNMKPDAMHAGPIGRISGAELVVDIECGNHRTADIEEDWNGKVCFLAVNSALQQFAIAEQKDFLGEAGYRQRLFHGLRIKLRTRGTVDRLDLNSLYTNFIEAAVLLQLPRMLILFIATTFLGHLSTIYKKVVHEHFNIPSEVGGIVTRLMASGVSFVGLADRVSKGISKQRLSERLRAALAHRTSALDWLEQEQLVEFCFRTVVNAGDYVSRIDGKFIREIFGRRRDEEEQERDVINVDDYSVACLSGERIGLEDVVHLFDRDRNVRWLERFFTPYYVKKHVIDHREAATVTQRVAMPRRGQVRELRETPKMFTSSPASKQHISPSSDLEAGERCAATSTDIQVESAIPPRGSLPSLLHAIKARSMLLDSRWPPRLQKAPSIAQSDSPTPMSRTPASVSPSLKSSLMLRNMSFDADYDELTLEQEKSMSAYTHKAVLELVRKEEARTDEIRGHVDEAADALQRRFELQLQALEDRLRTQFEAAIAAAERRFLDKMEKMNFQLCSKEEHQALGRSLAEMQDAMEAEHRHMWEATMEFDRQLKMQTSVLHGQSSDADASSSMLTSWLTEHMVTGDAATPREAGGGTGDGWHVPFVRAQEAKALAETAQMQDQAGSPLTEPMDTASNQGHVTRGILEPVANMFGLSPCTFRKAFLFRKASEQRQDVRC